jgi:hypothetical protein
MINFTLTITAAPELLAAISDFTNSITSAKVVTIPETNSEFTSGSYNQPVQIQSPASAAPIYNQPNIVPATQMINQGTVAYQVQTQQQTPAQAATQTTVVPTTTQTYNMEQLAVAATQIVDAGRRTELVTLLNSFGVQALTALPKEHYGAFATQLRALGAKI